MATEIRVPVRLEVLRDSISNLLKILDNLQPNTNNFKAVEKIINGMTSEALKLQALLSKSFTNENLFKSTNKTIDKLEESAARIQVIMDGLKFSDLKLTPALQDSFDALNLKIIEIKNNYLALVDAAKTSILSSKTNLELIAGLPEGKKMLNANFADIKAALDKHVSDLESAAQREELAYNKMRSNAERAARARILTSNDVTGGINRESLGESLFNTYLYTKDGENRLRPGFSKAEFLSALEESFKLEPGELQHLADLTLKLINEVFLNMGKNGKNIFEGLLSAYGGKGYAGKITLKEESLTELKNQLALYQLLLQEIEAAKLALNPLDIAALQLIAGLEQQLSSLEGQILRTFLASGQATLPINLMNTGLSQLRTTLELTNALFLQTQRVTLSFNLMKMAVVNFMGFNQVLNLTKNAIRNAINHIQELDSVMNKISIVTDMSTADLWNQVDAYSKMALAYGVSIKGAYEVSLIYYQQGLQTNDVLTLTNETLKLARISGLDYAQTTDYMTTALRGFKMEMSEASTVVDVYSNLASHTAVSLEELAVAMSKTASSMEGVGATFEEASAMIATMVAVTRESATNIGSAMKSIASRYGELTKDPMKLIDDEGEVMAFNKVDAALLSVGISMKTADGLFREFTDVIIELGEKWNELESVQLRYIATLFAGNRQQSRFLALVSNVDLLKANLDYAENSEDTGTLLALKALDSIEAKIELVRVAYQLFYTTVGIEDVWKGLLDGTKNVINTLNGLPKLFGKIPIGAIAAISSIVSLIKNLGLDLLNTFALTFGLSMLLGAILALGQAAEGARSLTGIVLSTIKSKKGEFTAAGQEAALAYTQGILLGNKTLTPDLLTGNKKIYYDNFNNVNTILNSTTTNPLAQALNIGAYTNIVSQLYEMGFISKLTMESMCLDTANYKTHLQELLVPIEEAKRKLLEIGNAAEQSGGKFKNFLSNHKNLSLGLLSFGSALNMIAMTINTTAEGGKTWSGVLLGMAAAATLAGVAVKVLDGGLKSIPWMSLASGVLMAINAISTLIVTPEERMEELTKKAEELNNLAKEAKANYRTLDNSIKKLDELKEKRYESAEAAEEYLTAVELLTDEFPELIAGFDATGRVIIDTIDAENLLATARLKSAKATYEAAEAALQESKERLNLIEIPNILIDTSHVLTAENIASISNSKTPFTSETLRKPTDASAWVYDLLFSQHWKEEELLNLKSYNDKDVLEKGLSIELFNFLKHRLLLLEKGIIEQDEAYEFLWKEDYFTDVTNLYNETKQGIDIEKIYEYVTSALEFQDAFTELQIDVIDTVTNETSALKEINLLIQAFNETDNIFSKNEIQLRIREEMNLLSDEMRGKYNFINVTLDQFSLEYLMVANLAEDYSLNLDAAIAAWANYRINSERAFEYISDGSELITLVNKQIASIVKTDYYNDWDAAKTAFSKQLPEIITFAETFWDSLHTIEDKEKFNSILSSNKYSIEDISSLYFTDAPELVEALKTARQQYETTILTNLIKNLLNIGINDDNEIYKAFTNKTDTSLESNLINEFLNVYTNYNKLGMTSLAEGYISAAKDFYIQIQQISDPSKRVSAIETLVTNGVNTVEGLRKSKKTFLTENLFKDLDFDSLILFISTNVPLAILSALSEFTNDWKDNNEALVKLISGGIEGNEVEEIINDAKNYGVDLSSDNSWEREGTKYLLTVEKWKEYRDAKNSELNTAMQDWLNDLNQILLMVTGSLDFTAEALHEFGIDPSKYFKDGIFDPSLFKQDAEAMQLLESNISNAWSTFYQLLNLRIRQEAELTLTLLKSGDYTSIKESLSLKGKETIERLKELALFENYTDDELKNKDIKEVVEGILKAYNSLISDLLSKGYENIDWDSYDYISEDNLKIDFTSYQELIKEYIKYAKLTIDEQNDLILKAYEKDREQFSEDLIKDFTFTDKDTFRASYDSLVKLANAYDKGIEELINAGQITFDETTLQYIMSVSQISKFGIDLSKIDYFNETVQESIDSLFSGLTSDVQKALEGKIDAKGVTQLRETLSALGLGGVELDFTRTAEGIKMTEDSFFSLYNNLKKVNSVATKSLIPAMKSQFKSLNNLTDAMEELEKAEQAKNEEKARAIADVVGEYLRESPEAYKMFTKDLPIEILKALNVIESTFAARDKVRKAATSGTMEFSDFYGILGDLDPNTMINGRSVQELIDLSYGAYDYKDGKAIVNLRQLGLVAEDYYALSLAILEAGDARRAAGEAYEQMVRTINLGSKIDWTTIIDSTGNVDKLELNNKISENAELRESLEKFKINNLSFVDWLNDESFNQDLLNAFIQRYSKGKFTEAQLSEQLVEMLGLDAENIEIDIDEKTKEVHINYVTEDGKIVPAIVVGGKTLTGKDLITYNSLMAEENALLLAGDNGFSIVFDLKGNRVEAVYDVENGGYKYNVEGIGEVESLEELKFALAAKAAEETKEIENDNEVKTYSFTLHGIKYEIGVDANGVILGGERTIGGSIENLTNEEIAKILAELDKLKEKELTTLVKAAGEVSELELELAEEAIIKLAVENVTLTEDLVEASGKVGTLIISDATIKEVASLLKTITFSDNPIELASAGAKLLNILSASDNKWAGPNNVGASNDVDLVSATAKTLNITEVEAKELLNTLLNLVLDGTPITSVEGEAAALYVSNAANREYRGDRSVTLLGEMTGTASNLIVDSSNVISNATSLTENLEELTGWVDKLRINLVNQKPENEVTQAWKKEIGKELTEEQKIATIGLLKIALGATENEEGSLQNIDSSEVDAALKAYNVSPVGDKLAILSSILISLGNGAVHDDTNGTAAKDYETLVKTLLSAVGISTDMIDLTISGINIINSLGEDGQYALDEDKKQLLEQLLTNALVGVTLSGNITAVQLIIDSIGSADFKESLKHNGTIDVTSYISKILAEATIKNLKIILDNADGEDVLTDISGEGLKLNITGATALVTGLLLVTLTKNAADNAKIDGDEYLLSLVDEAGEKIVIPIPATINGVDTSQYFDQSGKYTGDELLALICTELDLASWNELAEKVWEKKLQALVKITTDTGLTSEDINKINNFKDLAYVSKLAHSTGEKRYIDLRDQLSGIALHGGANGKDTIIKDSGFDLWLNLILSLIDQGQKLSSWEYNYLKSIHLENIGPGHQWLTDEDTRRLEKLYLNATRANEEWADASKDSAIISQLNSDGVNELNLALTNLLSTLRLIQGIELAPVVNTITQIKEAISSGETSDGKLNLEISVSDNLAENIKAKVKEIIDLILEQHILTITPDLDALTKAVEAWQVPERIIKLIPLILNNSSDAIGNVITKPLANKFRTEFTRAKGNVALAGGRRQTLMGELGPELYVQNGHYYIAGAQGPEMVSLDDDAIVFNHIQTSRLMAKGSTYGHGKPVTNEYKAAGMAHSTGMMTYEEALYTRRRANSELQDIKSGRLKPNETRIKELELLIDKAQEVIDKSEAYLKELKEALVEQKKIYKEGNVDLNNRKIISGEKMLAAGWGDFEDAYATLYSSTFASSPEADVQVVMNVTPITPDGEVLSPDELDQYVYDYLLNNGTNDIETILNLDKNGKGLVINIGNITGDVNDAIDEFCRLAETIHELLAELYNSTLTTAVLSKVEKLHTGYVRANSFSTNTNAASTSVSNGHYVNARYDATNPMSKPLSAYGASYTGSVGGTDSKTAEEYAKQVQSVISKLLEVGFEAINLDSSEFEKLDKTLKAEMKQYIAQAEASYREFVRMYGEAANLTVSEFNTLYFEAWQKDLGNTGESEEIREAARNLSFFAGGSIGGSAEDWTTLFGDYTAVVDLVNAKIIDWNESLLQYVITSIEDLQLFDTNLDIDKFLDIIADSILATTKAMVDLMSKAAEGQMTYADFNELNAYLELNKIEPVGRDLLILTTEGLKIPTEALIHFYSILLDVDAVAAHLTFKLLNTSLKETNDHYRSSTTILARIKDLQDAINNSERYSDEKIRQYKEELSLAEEILAVRATSEDDSFDFINLKLPGGMNNPLTYMNSVALGWKAFRDATKEDGSGIVDYQIFYNMAQEANNVAKITGLAFDFLGYTLDGKIENLSELMTKASLSLHFSEDGSDFGVALSEFGSNMVDGADSFSSSTDLMLHTMAESQIKVLDGLIAMFEMIVAMENFEGADLDMDGLLDLDEIFDLSGLTKDMYATATTFKTEFINGANEFLKVINSNEQYGAMADAITLLGYTIRLLIEDAVDNGIRDLDISAELYQQAVSALFEAFKNGDFNPDDIYNSLKEFLISNQSGYEGTFKLNDTIIDLKYGAEIKVSETGYEAAGKTYDNENDAIQAAILAKLGVKDILVVEGEASGTLTVGKLNMTVTSVDKNVTYNGQYSTLDNAIKALYEAAKANGETTLKLEEWKIKLEITVVPVVSANLKESALELDLDQINAAIGKSYEDIKAEWEAALGSEESTLEFEATYGIQLNKNTTEEDWARFKELAGIETKNVELNVAINVVNSDDVLGKLLGANGGNVGVGAKTEDAEKSTEKLLSDINNMDAMITVDVDDLATSVINSINKALDDLDKREITPTIKADNLTGLDTAVSASDTSGEAGATGTVSGTAMASGTQTLMGELGPELYVSNGRYHLAGQNGAEFINLPDDAIVFNHLLTLKLLATGSAGRGKPITNERNAVAMAHGTEGPAAASAKEILAQLKQMRAMWQSLANISVKEMAGVGGSEGGDSGTAKNTSWLALVERWYDLLQKIARLEKEINYQEALRNKLESDRVPNGKEYFDTLVLSLDNLKQQALAHKELAESLEDYFNQRRKELNERKSPFAKFYTFDEGGQLKYLPGAFDKLSDIVALDEWGKPKYTPQQQYDLMKSYGFESYMKYDNSGNPIDLSEEGWQLLAVQAVWERMEAELKEMQTLYDSKEELKVKYLDSINDANKLLLQMVDNQIDLEKLVISAIEERELAVIDALSDERLALADSTNAYIKGLLDSLDKERKMREKNDSDLELNKLLSRLSMLQRGGGSAAEIANLQREISDKQTDMYFDAQSQQIEAIQDASDLQLEKLQTQIDLMSESLAYAKENGLLWAEATEIMKLNPEVIALFITDNSPDFASQSIAALTEELRKILFSAEQFASYYDYIESLKEGKTPLDSTLFDLNTAINDGFEIVVANDENKEKLAYEELKKLREEEAQRWEIELEQRRADEKAQLNAAAIAHENEMYDLYGAALGMSRTKWDEQRAKGRITDESLQEKYNIDGITQRILELQMDMYLEMLRNKDNPLYSYWSNLLMAETQEQIKALETLRDKLRFEAYAKELGYTKRYAHGGLVNYTGLAMVHGSDARPEAFLNADEVKVWKEDILGSSSHSLTSQMLEMLSLYEKFNSTISSTYHNNSEGINIERVDVNMNVALLANDYDARRAGREVMNEILNIANKSSSGNRVGR